MTVKNTYLITPSFSEYGGWNFKEADSDFVIKFDNNKYSILTYAKKFCTGLNSDLLIFDKKGHLEDIINFRNNSSIKIPFLPILSGLIIFVLFGVLLRKN